MCHAGENAVSGGGSGLSHTSEDGRGGSCSGSAVLERINHGASQGRAGKGSEDKVERGVHCDWLFED